jgi:hypothetical protein
MHRRDLLRAGLALGAAAALPGFAGRAAAETKPRHLIVVFAYGGWDTTAVLDPKTPGGAADVGPGQLQRFGDIPIWTHASRPKVDEFFRAFGAMSAVVNGVQVRSIAHEECIKRMLTGGPSPEKPDVAAAAAYELGRELPVPYLVLGRLAMTGSYGAIAGRTGSINQLRTLVGEGGSYPAPAGVALPAPVIPAPAESDAVRAYLEASAAREAAIRGQRGANKKQLDDFVKSLDREGLLRSFVKANGGFGDLAYTPDLMVQTDIAIRAIERGLSHTVMMGGGFDWDTHTNNTQQSQLNERLYEGLIKLGRELERTKLLERTTVMVISEMGRTPKLNVGQGKDHWPVTSSLVFGAGVAGNRVVGGTDDALGARLVDFATGKPSDAGKQIQAANVAAAVLKIVGVDPVTYHPNAEALHALVA